MFKAIIIEDDPMVASINKQYLLTNSEFELIDIFPDGNDALEFLRNNAESIDLAILDYYMPRMNGKEFLKSCIKEGISVDVIMITAASDTDTVKELLRMGVTDYLVKPFTYERFQKAISKFISFRDTLPTGKSISQDELDSLMDKSATKKEKESVLEKGIQQQTLDLILEYMKENNNTYLSSDHVAKKVSLSRITVRRYMNYLLENNMISSKVDYGTGGRPSIKYRMK